MAPSDLPDPEDLQAIARWIIWALEELLKRLPRRRDKR